SAAVTVGYPLAVATRIVEVEHRGHGVDAQSVDVVTVEPKERIADQKAAHLVPPIIKNITVPLGLHSLARIGMLENMGTIEISETVRVSGKMGRHPIEDDANVV